jgi:site-specific recombinase XerD
MKCEIITGNLPQLWDELLQQLNRHNYHADTIRYYREGVGKIDYYLRVNDLAEYTAKIGQHFLSTYKRRNSRQPKSPRQYMKYCVNRLNDTLLSGEDFVVQHHLSQVRQPVLFNDIFLEFTDSLRKQGLREKTIGLQTRYCAEFLVFLESNSITALGEITPTNIYDAFMESSSKSGFRTSARKFLFFLYKRKILNCDFSVFVPVVHRPTPMPTTYSKDEISKLLNVIDRDSAKGRRDYAILLLAYCLGLRVSDICNLEFDNINRKKRTIDVIQMKTEIPVSLELLPEIEEAIDSYVRSGRPNSDSNKIFLRTMSPYLPISRTAVAHVIENYFKTAQVDTTDKKHGAHSLRMSLATDLVNEDVPYSTVQKILGQKHPESFKHYIQLDIEKLRTCALEVPPPSGRLALWLNQGGNR